MSDTNQTPAPAASQERRRIHARRTAISTYARPDGLWDIEGELLDTRGYAYRDPQLEVKAAEDPIHDMTLRLTVDRTLTIREAGAIMDATPFAECPSAGFPVAKLAGVRIGAGFRKQVEEVMGGVKGCTHLRDLVFQMGTAAVLAIPHYIKSVEGDSTKIDTGEPNPFGYMGQCMTWDFDGPLIARVAPRFAGWKPLKRS